ncbi:ethanolamine ammonia-lyase subunit EutC [Flammeovirgaceae bacterium SG7u.111]|nr:ethanolamine ammonia-lyase subunit EutC [Flammeovirgaceae bacterium SG7u.132]WPO36239.1 ethanolamine ammonia-lyase subunit EutC [Flammeovirgaceae bacterium SG7u.111]
MSLKPKNQHAQEDPWASLKEFTKARIALGNVGGSLPLNEVLAFKLAHAHAKDAIYSNLDLELFTQQFAQSGIPIFKLKSRVSNRQEYLKRPDLGRKLAKTSIIKLRKENSTFDIVFVISDGLSANGVNYHAIEVLKKMLPSYVETHKIAIALVEQGRVAIADEIGELLQAKFTAVMIGERPGLSSPQSMGIYTTYAPKPGLTDEKRNCISNIHEDGLSHEAASNILCYLIEQSFARKISGVELKVELGSLKK